MKPNHRRRVYYNFYETVYKPDHPSQYGGSDSPDWSRWVDSTRRAMVALFQRLGFDVNTSALVLELGCGTGYLKDLHPGWIGLEFSLSALRRMFPQAATQTNRLVNADMQMLPFKSGSVDLLFSWAAIEHVPKPELVMVEVERVLKPGGIAILAPSWNCRSWTVKRLKFRSYRELGWIEGVDKVTIPIRNNLIYRGLMALPFRIKREISAIFLGALEFDYRRLSPDFSTGTPHISDDDAYASMDPHAAIIYFKSRHWEILSHPTFTRRLLSRHEPVVVRKPT